MQILLSPFCKLYIWKKVNIYSQIRRWSETENSAFFYILKSYELDSVAEFSVLNNLRTFSKRNTYTNTHTLIKFILTIKMNMDRKNPKAFGCVTPETLIVEKCTRNQMNKNIYQKNLLFFHHSVDVLWFCSQIQWNRL